ncbi:MAG: multidrug efflux SMR transporter [Alphaproteobacteria bacterium]|jgi:quaternary ammonium compound-resistance protein SugE
MAFIFLVLAGILEIGWAVGMKYTDNFTKLAPTSLTILSMIFSLYFLSLAMKEIPLGTAYAIWTGIGIVGTCILGVILFGESTSILKFIFIGCILVGIIGLKLIE